MKNSELKEYISTFPDDAPVSLILANPRKRKLYKVVNILFVIDQENMIKLRRTAWTWVYDNRTHLSKKWISNPHETAVSKFEINVH